MDRIPGSEVKSAAELGQLLTIGTALGIDILDEIGAAGGSVTGP